MNILDTLKQKYYGIPLFVYVGMGIIGLALYLNHKKSQAGNSTQAAADQTNSNLGSASELANEFWQAGIMPFQGGDVYVTQTNTGVGATTPPAKTTLPGQISGPPAASKPRPVVTPVPKPPTVAKTPLPSTVDYAYKVKSGDTLTSIAKKYGLTVAELWNYNIGTNPQTSAMRPASTISTLKSRGQNLLFSGETIDIPKKGTVYAGGA